MVGLLFVARESERKSFRILSLGLFYHTPYVLEPLPVIWINHVFSWGHERERMNGFGRMDGLHPSFGSKCFNEDG